MDVKTLQDLFFAVLRSELTEAELDCSVREQLTQDVISALYQLAKKHDLAHIISASLCKYGLLTEGEILDKLNREEMLSVYRHAQMEYAYGQICDTFDREQIPYIPLKGSVIRPYYPKESMRTSCDIDILVKEEDLNRAVDSLVQQGFLCGEKNYHDVSLHSPNQIHLELHFNILETIDNLDAVLQDAWLYTKSIEGSRYAFTDEFFLFHMFAHMSYHFLSGGCGVRSLLDVWVMEHRMGISHHQAKDLLQLAEIDRFADEIVNLVEICFSGKPKEDFTDELLWYILAGGAFGNLENKIAISENKSHVNMHYISNRIFVPYRDLVIEYPSLKKCCLLYPFFWVHRTFRLAFRLLKNTLVKKKAKKGVSDEQSEQSLRLKKRLGL